MCMLLAQEIGLGSPAKSIRLQHVVLSGQGSGGGLPFHLTMSGCDHRSSWDNLCDFLQNNRNLFQPETPKDQVLRKPWPPPLAPLDHCLWMGCSPEPKQNLVFQRRCACRGSGMKHKTRPDCQKQSNKGSSSCLTMCPLLL